MKTEGAQKQVNHTAKLSAAFLTSCYPEPDRVPERAKRVIVKDNGVYVSTGDHPALFFSDNPDNRSLDIRSTQYLGHAGSIACYAVEISSESELPGWTYYPGVRDLFGILPDKELAVAALAVRLTDFDRTTRFCGRCGAGMQQSRQERAKICPSCGLTTYPCVSPAIIVLVRKDDTILLARSPRFPPDLYGVIAGFVEPKETLEEAIHREVREETGIEITRIRYFGSEPWPFPTSLMIGFNADYAGGELAIDNDEIISAGWFDHDHLPRLPSTMSISRALIDQWIKEMNDETR